MSTHSEASHRYFKETCASLAGGSSTNSKAYEFETEPVIVTRGKGCRIWNLDGKEYIDFKNGLGPITLGYSVEEINEAIRRQLELGIVFGAPHELEGRAARELSRVIPCAEKVRFLKTGGEAIAAAIKLARAFTGRDDIVQCGYNGWLNTLSAGPQFTQRISREDALSGVPIDVSRHHAALSWNDTEGWERTFEANGDAIAAVVVASDYRDFYAGRSFLPFLRDITRRYGALLIVDEIVTGFRVAIGGVHQLFGFEPDLAVFAKGMTNGMPLSVYCGRADIMDLAPRLGISSTNAGETLSLAALLKVIEIYERHDVVAHLATVGERLWTQVEELISSTALSMTLHGHPAAKFFVFRDDATRAAFFRSCSEEGISLYNPSYVSFSHKDEDIAEAVRRFADALHAAEGALT